MIIGNDISSILISGEQDILRLSLNQIPPPDGMKEIGNRLTLF